MANEDIGTAPNPFGSAAGPCYVRRAKTGRFPLYLWTDITGPLFMKTAKGQEWVLEHAAMYGPAGSPQEPPAIEAPPEPGAQPALDPPAKRRSFLPDLL